MAHISNHERAVLDAKVGVRKEGQNCDHLVLMPESRDQRAYILASSKIMQ